MTRNGWLQCAAAFLLLGAVGCHALEFFGVSVDERNAAPAQPNDGSRLVKGELESVVQTSQGLLTSIGVAATASREGEMVRLKCATSRGGRFVLVFERVDQKTGMHTRVRVEWDGTTKEPLAFQFLGALDALEGR